MQPSEHIFRSIVEASPFPVYLCVGEEKIVTVANDATLKAWGKDSSVIGKRFDDALPELHDQPFSRQISEVFNTGVTYYGGNNRADLLIDGIMQTYYFKFTYQAMHDVNGKIYGVVCFATDVTEIERARQAVEESQRTLYNILMQAPVGICVIRGEDLIVDMANDVFLKLVGKQPENLVSQVIWEGVPEAAAYYAPIMDNVITTGQSYVAKERGINLIRNNVEETVFVDFVYEPVKDIDGVTNSIMVIAIEVTHSVMARRNIEEAEERARLAAEAAEIGTFDLDFATNVMLTSDRFNTIFGFDEQVTREAFAGVIQPEFNRIRAEAHKESLTSGKLFYEARVIWKDQSQHWVRVQGKIYYNERQEPARLLGTVLDITEYKHLQQQKDDFISVASHELKTPLTSVKASMQLLDRLVKTNLTSEKVPMFVNKANSSLIKMQHLVDSLLNVSKIASGQLELYKTRFRIADLINESCDHIRFMDTHQLILQGDTDMEIYADRERIEQVVVNLVNNAVKYAPESDTIIVNILNDGVMVKISVQDFGRGIAAEKIPHIFDRYYRVDETGIQYSGLGLGLYISYEIVNRHNGQIGVESEIDKGSTFWFTIPIHGRWFY